MVSLLAAGALVAVMALPASAATVSQAQATAVTASVLNLADVNTGQASSVNDGSTAVVTDGTNTATLPASQISINAGALAQQTRADNGGNSGACAGIVKDGAAIQIGSGNDCTVSGGTTPPVVGVNGVLTLTADAITSHAQAGPSNGPAPTGGADLANAALAGAGVLALILNPVTIPANPAPNTTITVTANVLGVGTVNVATLVLNKQTANVNGPGSLRVDAVDLTVLAVNVVGLTLTSAHVVLGTSIVGSNAEVNPVSAVAGLSWPWIAGGIAALSGIGALIYARRRRGALA